MDIRSSQHKAASHNFRLPRFVSNVFFDHVLWACKNRVVTCITEFYGSLDVGLCRYTYYCEKYLMILFALHQNATSQRHKNDTFFFAWSLGCLHVNIAVEFQRSLLSMFVKVGN